MDTVKRNRLTIFLLALALLAVILAFIAPEIMRRPVPDEKGVRSIQAAKTAWPMLAIRDAGATDSIPPLRPTYDPLYTVGARQALAWDCNNPLLSTTWPTAGTANIDWSDYDECFTNAANYTVTLSSGVTISQPVVIDLPPQFVTTGGGGTAGNPYSTLYVPTWMTAYATTFTTVSGGVTYYYKAIKYDDATFLSLLTSFITAAADRYGSNPQLAGVRVYVGLDGESQPNRPQAATPEADLYFLQAIQSGTGVTCTEYRTFIETLAEAAEGAFTSHEVVVMGATDPCYEISGDRFRRDTINAWATDSPQKRIGISMNSLVGDQSDADEATGNVYQAWKKLTVGNTVDSYGFPVWLEFGNSVNAGDGAYGDDPWQTGYWALLAAMGAEADWASRNYTWNNFRTYFDWEIGDYGLGDGGNRLWIVARDLEYPTYNWDAFGTYGVSGYRGNFEKNGTLLTPQAYPQACSQSIGPSNTNLRATAVAAVTAAVAAGYSLKTPAPCVGTALPTPKATYQPTPSPNATSDYNTMQRLFNRQARQITAGSTMAIAADTAWAPYGDTRSVKVTLSYLDTGTGTITLTLPIAGGTASYAFNKANTGLWQRTSWTYGETYINNGVGTATGDAFIAVTSSDVTYVHEVYADVATSSGTATPTLTPSVTPTPSNTPTETATPTETFTPTPSNTPSPTNTVAVATSTYTPTPSPTNTGVPVELFNTATITPTATSTVTPSATPTATDTLTPSATPTVTNTPYYTPRPTYTPWATYTPNPTYTPVATYTPCPSCNIYTYCIDSQTSTALANVIVAVSAYRDASVIQATGITNAYGCVCFGLEVGNWYFFRYKSGYTFVNPDYEAIPTATPTATPVFEG